MTNRAGSQVSHYRLIEQIGAGGRGVVWKALDLELDREVAVKFLSEDFEADETRLARFRHEAKTLAALNHPNIVTVHSIEQVDGRTFITMEFVPGKRLSELIPSSGFESARFFDLAIPMAQAIVAAHERKIVHRDLKPGNVMVGDDGRLRILDFGLAEESQRNLTPIDDEETTRSLSDSNGVSGTLHYMSPEQFQGQPAEPRSDIFSLGIVLYEMASGSRPFRGRNAADLIAAVLRDSPIPLHRLKPSTPRHLSRVIERCLVKEPEQRLGTARELLRELSRLKRGDRGESSTSQPTTAVLPFTDMSESRDQDYFCEGVAEEIINALNRVQGLRVASRTSSFQFRQTRMDAREIGDRLGVETLMEGSVRKAGDHLRVTATLINVADGYPLWTERFDSEPQDIFAIQDQIAQNVVQALQVTLKPSERRALRQVATASVQAFDYYLRGRNFYNRYGQSSVEFALRMFSRAIEADPAYALAHAGISDCHAYLYLHAGRDEGDRLQADLASRRALELDPESAEAHSSRGVALSISDQYEAAETAFEAALELNPRLFDAAFAYARQAFIRHESDKAIELYALASRLRPDDYQCPLLVAQTFADLGREEEARAERVRGIENAEEHLDLNPDDVRALYMGANGLVALGEVERGLEWADRARAIDPDDPMLLYNLSCIYSLSDQAETALDCLEQAVAKGFNHIDWIRNDSNLDLIREDPRYRDLVAAIAGR